MFIGSRCGKIDSGISDVPGTSAHVLHLRVVRHSGVVAARSLRVGRPPGGHDAKTSSRQYRGRCTRRCYDDAGSRRRDNPRRGCGAALSRRWRCSSRTGAVLALSPPSAPCLLSVQAPLVWRVRVLSAAPPSQALALLRVAEGTHQRACLSQLCMLLLAEVAR
jgi:hypothetical protein